VNGTEIAPDPIERANHCLTGFGAQGGSACLIASGHRSDAQHGFNVAPLSQLG